jgi:hypothetical protein
VNLPTGLRDRREFLDGTCESRSQPTRICDGDDVTPDVRDEIAASGYCLYGRIADRRDQAANSQRIPLQ